MKIDRSFIGRLGLKDTKGEMVETILGMAHNFEIEVVAEGVETTGQMDALKRLACGFMQGYLFSRPITAAEIQSRYLD